jgi:hypothetical protein
MSSIENRAAAVTASTIKTAVICGFHKSGAPLVRIAGQDSGACDAAARSVVPIAPELLGAEVIVGFEGGDLMSPVILGVLQSPSAMPYELRLTAKDRIEISCGKAGITMHADGKIVVHGEYLISRARRTNRIEGGAIQIN